MTSDLKCNLEFDPRALKEWKKLGSTIQFQFKRSVLMITQSSDGLIADTYFQHIIIA